MTLVVTVLEGSLAGQSFQINADQVTVGRGPGVDLEIKDASISKVHARIECQGDQIRVLDLGSRNGIRVDGKVVNKVRLKQGVVHIGKIPISLQLEGSLPQPASIPQASEASLEGSLPPSPEERPASKGMMMAAYGFFALLLAGILIYGFKDEIWPTQEKLEEFYKFTFSTYSSNDYPFSIQLPGRYGDAPGKEFESAKGSFWGKKAEGSNTVFLIYAKDDIGEPNSMTIRLEDGRRLHLNVRIFEDSTPIIAPEVSVLSDEDVAALIESYRNKVGDDDKEYKSFSEEDKIELWGMLKSVIDSAEARGRSYDDMSYVMLQKENLDIQFRNKRNSLFQSAKNHWELYSTHNRMEDLNKAIEIMERLISFTDKGGNEEDESAFARYNQLHKHLLTQKKHAGRTN